MTDLEPRLTPAGDPSSGVGSQLGAFEVLAAYGIPIPVLRPVASEAEALAAAADIGYPVVLKTAAAVDHKTESRGVVLGVGDEDALRNAYRDLSEALGPDAVVFESVPPGVEVGMGMVNDPQFGPVVILSAGGTLIEVIADRVAVLPPVDSPRARAALDRLAIRSLFGGVRGGPPLNIDALAEVVTRFSELAVDAAETLAAIDVNPVIVGHQGAIAVDALFKGKT